MRGGARSPSAPLPVHIPLGVAPLYAHGGMVKGGRAFPHANGGRGACRTGCVPPPILTVPPCAPSPLPDWGAAFSAPHSRRQGRSRKRAVVHPPFVCHTHLGEQHARGRGLCRTPAFLCPVGARTSPHLCINGGMIKGGVAGGPVLPVLFDLSGGRGERVRVCLCAPLYIPRLHTKAGWRKPHTEGGRK